MMRSMQDDPTKIADLQRAKFVMGLGHPINRKIEPAQAKRILTALAALPRKQDQKRIIKGLNLLGDCIYANELAKY